MHHFNPLIFILASIKVSIFCTMALSELIRFLKNDYPCLYRVLSLYTEEQTLGTGFQKLSTDSPPFLDSTFETYIFHHI